MTATSDDSKWTEESIWDIRFWTDTLLSFKTTRPAQYLFKPGHYSRLGLQDEHGQLIWRAYSVVSAPAEDFLEYYGVIVPGGMFTSRLQQLRPGDRIYLDKQAFGFMTADRFTDGDTLWMLATGTGLGPFISILRDGAVWKQFRRLVLVHGTRHVADLSYTDELQAIQAIQAHGSSQLQLLQSVTRDGDGTPLPAGVLHGRITTLLESGQLEQAAGQIISPEAARVMLCGNPAMIEETRALLHARGMRPLRRASPGHFVAENYW